MNFQTKNTLKNLCYNFKMTLILLIKKIIKHHSFIYTLITKISNFLIPIILKDIKKIFESMIQIDFQRIFLLKIHNFLKNYFLKIIFNKKIVQS